MNKTTKLLSIILVFFLAGCGFTSKVTLINSSTEDLKNVQIFASESLIWQGDLAAESSISADFNVQKDGALRVTGYGNSNFFDSDYLGYTAPDQGNYHKIVYEGQGITSYDYSTKEF